MKLVVFSPEQHRPDEPALVRAFLAQGLERYHVRKPTWSRDQLQAWLSAFTPVERARMVTHTHHDLAGPLGVGGIHARDQPARAADGADASRVGGFRSRSCHRVADLAEALPANDAVFISPLFPSYSKPGYGSGAPVLRSELEVFLSPSARAARAGRGGLVFGLGGVNEARVAECQRLGLDGVGVLGAVWHASDPLEAFRRLQAVCRAAAGLHPVLPITQDGLPFSHEEQAEQLCEGGAEWIQLRMKGAAPEAWVATARRVVEVCRRHRARCVVNDSVDVALAAGADGVHLGSQDLDWREARARLGAGRILGGTVNSLEDAARAVSVRVLDYVGVGPWRFTTTKKKLSPVLGPAGVGGVISALDGLPAWVIGGITRADLPDVCAAGAAGVAVSSALLAGGLERVEGAFRSFAAAWPQLREARTYSSVSHL